MHEILSTQMIRAVVMLRASATGRPCNHRRSQPFLLDVLNGSGLGRIRVSVCPFLFFLGLLLCEFLL